MNEMTQAAQLNVFLFGISSFFFLSFKNSVMLHFPDSSVGKESACNAGDPGLIPESGRSTGEGIG